MLPEDTVVENLQYKLDKENAEERNVRFAKEFRVQHREVRDWGVDSQKYRTYDNAHQDHALEPPVIVQVSGPST